MKGLENIAPEVAKDLIKLINSLRELPKNGLKKSLVMYH